MTSNPRNTNGARRRATRARVLHRDDLCWLCHRPVDKTLKTPDPGSPEVHEIIPVSRGGSPTSLANTTLTHRACNRWISDRTPDELAKLNDKGKPQPFETSQTW
jgi:5-methylcytosine-specific restriction endonuclease McrA